MIGPSPNPLILSYLKYAISSQVIALPAPQTPLAVTSRPRLAGKEPGVQGGWWADTPNVPSAPRRRRALLLWGGGGLGGCPGQGGFCKWGLPAARRVGILAPRASALAGSPALPSRGVLASPEVCVKRGGPHLKASAGVCAGFSAPAPSAAAAPGPCPDLAVPQRRAPRSQTAPADAPLHRARPGSLLCS